MEFITCDRDGHVLLIGLNRPKKYNAMNRAMYRELADAYGLLEQDADLRCALVFAHGEHFTAGLQLDEWAEVFGSGEPHPLTAGQVDPFGVSSERVSKPVIFAVHGICFTWGVELMLCGDIRVAASNTRFGQLEVKRGIHACLGATLRLTQEIGWSNAQRYLLTGDEWSAEDAYRLGMVQQVTEPGQEYEAALELARRVAKAAPLGVQGSLKSSLRVRRESEKAALAAMYKDLAPIMQSEDVAEGVQSFLERREAAFTGR